MIDLSKLLPGDPVTALAPTSQAAGNMMSSNRLAMAPPGSEPTDPLPPASDQGDPTITPSNSSKITPGTDGKPDPASGWNPGRPSWAKPAIPDVVRRPMS